MFNTTAPKSTRNTLTISVGMPSRRLVRHNSEGKHADRRLKRQSTRSSRFQAAVKE